ncbi:hypothetical protein TNCV_3404811 [Trichonephila clavipes]|nr:hypothetical protein TNCV_3404811 [Trichonephila clavipes]
MTMEKQVVALEKESWSIARNIETVFILLDKLQKPLQEEFWALHTEEAFNGLFDFSITSKATSGEIFRQSRKQMKVTWCEIRTVIQVLQITSCNMVLRCRRRVWTRIIIQQQNARFEKPRSLFANRPLQFRQGVTVLTAQHRWFQSPKSPRKSKRFFRKQIPELFWEGFLKLIQRYNKCFTVLGTYVEKYLIFNVSFYFLTFIHNCDHS